MARMINCPYCGKLTDPKLDNCVHCGGMFRKTAGQAPPPAQRAQTCPNCGARVAEGEIICANCGTNLLTGQRLTDEGEIIAPTNWRKVAVFAGAAVAGIALIVLGAFLVYAVLRDPVERAQEMIRMNQLSEAASLLEQHVAEHDDDAMAHFELGRVYWMTNRYEEAGDEFTRTMQLDRDSQSAAMLAAASYAQVEGPGTRAKVLTAAENWAKRFPEDPRAWYFLSLARGMAGNVAEQVESLQRTIELAPDNQQARAALGVAQALAGDVEAAEAQMLVALNDNPTDPDLLATSGMVSFLADDPNEAVVQLRMALEKPTALRSQAAAQLGLLLYSQGRYTEAEGYLAEAIEAAQSSPAQVDAAVPFFLALCLLAEGDANGALRDLESLSRQQNQPYAADAAVLAADLHLDDDDAAAARDALDRAAQLGATGAPYHTVRSRLARAAGDPREATRAVRQAIQTDGEYAPAYLEQGLLSLQQGDTAEGVRSLQRYLALADPNDPGARLIEVEELIQQLQEAGEVDAVAVSESPERRGA